MSNSISTVEDTIATRIEAEFSPIHFTVENESGNHNVAPGSESHFKVVLVSERFEGMSLIARHRQVNKTVDMPGLGIHALALHTYTPSEWSTAGGTDSPDCLGGNGK